MQIFSWRKRPTKNSWYHLYLDPVQLADNEQQRLQMRFERAFQQARCPRGMNLWLAPTAEDDADIFMSPASRRPASELIIRYQAQACNQPMAALLLLAGCQQHAKNKRVLQDGMASAPGGF